MRGEEESLKFSVHMFVDKGLPLPYPQTGERAEHWEACIESWVTLHTSLTSLCWVPTGWKC